MTTSQATNDPEGTKLVHQLHMATYNRLADDITEGKRAVDDFERYLFAGIGAIYSFLLSQHGAIDRLRGEILLWLPPALIIIFLTRIFRNNRRAANRSRYMSEIEKFVFRQSNVEPTVRGYETILTEQREGRSAWSVAVCPGAPVGDRDLACGVPCHRRAGTRQFALAIALGLFNSLKILIRHFSRSAMGLTTRAGRPSGMRLFRPIEMLIRNFSEPWKRKASPVYWRRHQAACIDKSPA